MKNFKLWSEQRKLKSEFEGFFWVPADSYKFANDFRIKYQGQFTEEILETLLFEVIINRFILVDKIVK